MLVVVAQNKCRWPVAYPWRCFRQAEGAELRVVCAEHECTHWTTRVTHGPALPWEWDMLLHQRLMPRSMNHVSRRWAQEERAAGSHVLWLWLCIACEFSSISLIYFLIINIIMVIAKFGKWCCISFGHLRSFYNLFHSSSSDMWEV